MSKKRLTEMSVDQPQTSQSMDLWIGLSVSVKIIRRGSAVAFGDKAFGCRCTKDIYEKAASAIQEFDKIGSPPMPLNMAFWTKAKE